MGALTANSAQRIRLRPARRSASYVARSTVAQSAWLTAAAAKNAAITTPIDTSNSVAVPPARPGG